MTDKERERRRKKFEEDYKPAFDAWIQHYPFTTENLDGEIWRPVPDYEELYHCSNFGRVKRFYKNGNVIILKPTLNAQSYLRVSLCKNDKQKDFRLNVLVARLFIPNPENKPEVNHRYSRFSNQVDCLEWATHAENMEHAVRTGLYKSGEKHHNAKLTNEQVIYIRENPDGLTGRQLAEMFGVGPMTISDIQRGKKYKTMGGNIREKKPPGLARIPDEMRAQIIADYQKGVPGHGCIAVGKRFGVSNTTVYNIVNGRR